MKLDGLWNCRIDVFKFIRSPREKTDTFSFLNVGASAESGCFHAPKWRLDATSSSLEFGLDFVLVFPFGFKLIWLKWPTWTPQ